MVHGRSLIWNCWKKSGSTDTQIRNCEGISHRPFFARDFMLRRGRPHTDEVRRLEAEFHLKKHSSVSSVLERTEKRLAKERRFKKRVETLRDVLDKGQTETPCLNSFWR